MISAKVTRNPQFRRRIDQQHERILFRLGAYAATTEARMFKRRKGSAPPGHPPYAHAPGKRGMKDVRYEVNKAAKSVTTGHTLYRGHRSSKPFPQLMDEGGTVLVKNNTFSGEQVTTVARYRPHPFQKRAMQTAVRQMRRILAAERL